MCDGGGREGGDERMRVRPLVVENTTNNNKDDDDDNKNYEKKETNKRKGEEHTNLHKLGVLSSCFSLRVIVAWTLSTHKKEEESDEQMR